MGQIMSGGSIDLAATTIAMTAAGTVDGTELLAIVQGGNSRKLTTLLLAGAILGGTVLPGIVWDQTNRALAITTIANPAASALTITSGAITGTTSYPALTVNGTFNNSGLTGTLIKANLTDTSSNAASLLIDLQVATVSKFKVRKDGNISAVGGLDSGVNVWTYTNAGAYYFGASADLALFRDAANTLAQRNGTNAQRNKIFNTWTDASNGEWFEVDWITNANVATIGTNKNGTGSTRNLRVNVGGTNQLDFGVTTASVWTTPSAFVTSATTDSTTTTSGALQVAGGAAIRKRVFIDGITTSAGVQTAVLCQSSGGEMIADSVACLASSERFKTMLGNAERGALDKIIRVPVRKWEYRREPDSVFPDNYYAERIGPTAEDIAAIDSRLVGRDKEGNARNISTDQLLALAIQAIQEQQEQIEGLQMRLAA